MTPTQSQGPHPGQPSVIAGYALAIASALEHDGIDSHRVFRIAGINEAVSNDPMHRLSTIQITALYRACVEATRDPYFGLKAARFIRPSNLHVLGYALLASSSLNDFCQRLVRYLGVATQSATAECEVRPGEVELRLRHRGAAVCSESEDAFLAVLIRFIRILRSEHFTPLEIQLHHACPPQGAGPYQAAFGVVPSFNCNVSALILPAKGMHDKLPGACAELAIFNDKLAGDYLSRLNDGDVFTSVRTKVLALLPTGDCSRARVADLLHISEQTLQARLAKCGTSFNDILDDTRKELAISHITQRGSSITEIALTLGFTESSNFTRAFKRWTGLSPSDYREKDLHRQLSNRIEQTPSPDDGAN